MDINNGMSDDLMSMYLNADNENGSTIDSDVNTEDIDAGFIPPIQDDEEGDDDNSNPENDDNNEDPDVVEETNEDPDNDEPPTDHPDTINPIIAKLLKSKNLDPYKLKIDEDGIEVERSFDELSEEAQMNILNYNPTNTLNELDPEEINTIQYLRDNKTNINDLINYHRDLAVQQYISYQEDGNLDLDAMDADDLYFNHLASEYPELNEDQLNRLVAKEKEELDIYNIKVDKLRSFYKEKQAAILTENQEKIKYQEEQNYTEAVNSIRAVLDPLTTLNSAQIEDNDKQEILSYLLDKGADGRTSFVKDLDNPENLVKIAWFLNYGDQAHNLLLNYFTDAVKKAGDEGYKKGKAEIKGKLKDPKPKPKTTIKTNESPANPKFEGIPAWQMDFLKK